MDEIAKAAEQALHDAYWRACDEARRALDPDELTTCTWAAEMLAEAYEIALQIESDPLGWEEGRAKW